MHLQDLDRILDGGQRIAQLVCQHRQELVLPVIGLLQRQLQPFSFQSVMDGPHQHARPGLALYQVVLGALADGLDPDGLVLQARENNDGQVRSGVNGPFQRGQTRAIRQRQVEQDGIDWPTAFQVLRSLLPALDVCDLQVLVKLRQPFLQQIGISRIVFDQQDVQIYFVHD